MVKGITKQVIVVHSPDRKLFEQAIFILNEEAVGEGITDEILLKEAKKAVRGDEKQSKFKSGPLWAFAGAAVTGIAWIVTQFL